MKETFRARINCHLFLEGNNFHPIDVGQSRKVLGVGLFVYFTLMSQQWQLVGSTVEYRHYSHEREEIANRESHFSSLRICITLRFSTVAIVAEWRLEMIVDLWRNEEECNKNE